MRRQIEKNKLRYYRRLLNWTQLQLAEAVGFEQANGQIYISRYERGIYRTPRHLKPKIASVLGLPVEVIFPDSEVLNNEKTNPKG